MNFLLFLESSFFDALRSFQVVVTPLTMICGDVQNRTITNSFGIWDNTSAVFSESSDLAIIWKIIVGINQTQS